MLLRGYGLIISYQWNNFMTKFNISDELTQIIERNIQPASGLNQIRYFRIENINNSFINEFVKWMKSKKYAYVKNVGNLIPIQSYSYHNDPYTYLYFQVSVSTWKDWFIQGEENGKFRKG